MKRIPAYPRPASQDRVVELRVKITDLVKKSPEKAVVILKSWMDRPSARARVPKAG